MTLNSKRTDRQSPEAKLAGLPTSERDCSPQEGHPDAHGRHKRGRGPGVDIGGPTDIHAPHSPRKKTWDVQASSEGVLGMTDEKMLEPHGLESMEKDEWPGLEPRVEGSGKG